MTKLHFQQQKTLFLFRPLHFIVLDLDAITLFRLRIENLNNNGLRTRVLHN